MQELERLQLAAKEHDYADFGKVEKIILMDEPFIEKDYEFANLVSVHEKYQKYYLVQQALQYSEAGDALPFVK